MYWWEGSFKCIHETGLMDFPKYWPTSNSRNTHLELEYLSENSPVYYLDVYLSVCKRIFLDDQYFMLILRFENVGNLLFDEQNCLQKQGKKYQNSDILSNNFTFLLIYMYF